MWKRFWDRAGPIVILFAILGAVFLFLGLEMSSPYTRESPDCSVWCVVGKKLSALFGLDAPAGGSN